MNPMNDTDPLGRRIYVDDDDENDFHSRLDFLFPVSSVETYGSEEEHLYLNEEQNLKKKMAFFFMDPIQKWKARKQIPWKLVLQFLKLVFVTLQLVIFCNFRYAHTNYNQDSHTALQHFFLKDWDEVREIHAYPPPTGTYAIYKRSSFYNYLDFALKAFKNLPDEAINLVKHSRNGTIGFCVESAPKLSSNTVKIQCLEIELESISSNFSSLDYLNTHNFTIPWTRAERMHLNFTIMTKTTRHLDPINGPECFEFFIKILFENSDHDGQIPVELISIPLQTNCESNSEKTLTTFSILIRILNYWVVLLCTSSLILCIRALVRAHLLKMEAVKFFKRRFGWSLSYKEMLDFLNIWYILICINDVLIIFGSIIKDAIESRYAISYSWDICSLCLGCGNLLVWIGMLRYLGFFKTYNVLILTLKGCVPNVMRFLLCASLIYFGFVFCGWVILGPYHFKFNSILSTSECLFSLINGDDMFATFNSMPNKASPIVWAFSKIYLYIFISLFIYVILSLFIAIIMDTYDIIKDYYKHGWPVRRIHSFYQRANYDPDPSIFQDPDLFTYDGQSGIGVRRVLRNMSSVISSSVNS
uniref:Transient receptor potential mucolipin [Apis mellifera] n=1 Tax=Lepeophtheirus salmonis TaxID=72036 RepID=A0A0K2UKF4_LEPSM